MEVEINQPVKVNLTTVSVHVKVSDSGSYTLVDSNGNKIKEHDGYVPGFFPGEHYGDYLILDIDLKTGQIMNWKKSIEREVKEFLSSDEE